jgi:ubiquinone/menaquinone biosynthesis C-methylase UbiE
MEGMSSENIANPRTAQKEWIYRNFAPAGKSWLDFGCGTGEMTAQLAPLGAAGVVAIDVTPGLNNARSFAIAESFEAVSIQKLKHGDRTREITEIAVTERVCFE